MDSISEFVLNRVTREHRENLAKNAKVIFNKTKTGLQSVQNKYVKQCKSPKEGISEDLAFSVQQQVIWKKKL
jgi:ribosome recycling factor